MKNQLLVFSLFAVLIGSLVVTQGCKKDDNPATPAAAVPTGSFSFATDSGNFSASGAYNLMATSGSGAGWYDANTILAYAFTSPTAASVVMLRFMTAPAVGSYQFPSTASMAWAFNATSINTSGARLCSATGGTVNISTHGGGVTQGNFNGSGCVVQATSHTFSITNGTFNVNSGAGKRGMMVPEVVDRIARMMSEKIDQ